MTKELTDFAEKLYRCKEEFNRKKGELSHFKGLSKNYSLSVAMGGYTFNLSKKHQNVIKNILIAAKETEIKNLERDLEQLAKSYN